MVTGILSELGLSDEELNKRLLGSTGIDFAQPNVTAEINKEISLIQGEEQALPATPVAQALPQIPTQQPQQPQQTTQSLIDSLVKQQLLAAAQPLQPAQAVQPQPSLPPVPITGTQRTTGVLAGISQALAGVGASIAGRDPTGAIAATRKIQQEQDLLDPNSKVSRAAQENLRRIRDANPSQFGFLTDDVIKAIPAGEQNLILDPSKLFNSLKTRQPSLAEVLRTSISAQSLGLREKDLDLKEIRETRLEKNQVFKISDELFKRSERFVKDFNKDKIVQNSRDNIAKAAVATEIINSDNLLGRAVITRLLARMAGEVGVMTDADVNSFELRMKSGIESWLKTTAQSFLKGRLSQREKDIMNDLVNRLARRNRENIRNQAGFFVGQRVNFSNQEKSILFNILVPQGTTIGDDILQSVRKGIIEGGKEPSFKTIPPAKEAPQKPLSLQDALKQGNILR